MYVYIILQRERGVKGRFDLAPSINPSEGLTDAHTCKEKPFPSTATGGSKPCVTKWCRPWGLCTSRKGTRLCDS